LKGFGFKAREASSSSFADPPNRKKSLKRKGADGSGGKSEKKGERQKEKNKQNSNLRYCGEKGVLAGVS